MPTYHYHVTDIVPASQYGERAAGTSRLTDYDAKPHNAYYHTSVYSAHAAPVLVKSFGPCEGCHCERELINDYCDTCRTLGANESAIMGAAHDSETSRKNSENSCWRLKA